MSERSAVLSRLPDPLGELLCRLLKICQSLWVDGGELFLLVQLVGQSLGQQSESGQFLTDAIVQIAADATLFVRGNFQDFSFQQPPIADVLAGTEQADQCTSVIG